MESECPLCGAGLPVGVLEGHLWEDHGLTDQRHVEDLLDQAAAAAAHRPNDHIVLHYDTLAAHPPPKESASYTSAPSSSRCPAETNEYSFVPVAIGRSSQDAFSGPSPEKPSSEIVESLESSEGTMGSDGESLFESQDFEMSELSTDASDSQLVPDEPVLSLSSRTGSSAEGATSEQASLRLSNQPQTSPLLSEDEPEEIDILELSEAAVRAEPFSQDGFPEQRSSYPAIGPGREAESDESLAEVTLPMDSSPSRASSSQARLVSQAVDSTGPSSSTAADVAECSETLFSQSFLEAASELQEEERLEPQRSEAVAKPSPGGQRALPGPCEPVSLDTVPGETGAYQLAEAGRRRQTSARRPDPATLVRSLPGPWTALPIPDLDGPTVAFKEDSPEAEGHREKLKAAMKEAATANSWVRRKLASLCAEKTAGSRPRPRPPMIRPTPDHAFLTACRLCGHKVSKDGFRHHVRMHSDVVRKAIGCGLCDYQTQERKKLVGHQRREHGVHNGPDNTIFFAQRNASHLNALKEKCFGDYKSIPYTQRRCRPCDRTMLFTNVRNHITCVHLKLPMYKCRLCLWSDNRYYIGPANMHVREVHPGEDVKASLMSYRDTYKNRIEKLVLQLFDPL